MQGFELDTSEKEISEVQNRVAYYVDRAEALDEPRIGLLAQAAKSHLRLIKIKVGHEAGPPLIVGDLKAEIQNRICIPPRERTENETAMRLLQKFDQFIADTLAKDKLVIYSNEPDTILLTEEEYESWMVCFEKTAREHRWGGMPREEWLGCILEKSVKEFNLLREKHPSWGILYFKLPSDSGKCLAGANLAGVAVAPAEMTEADFSYCYFRGSQFYDCPMSKAKLSWADFSNSTWWKTNLKGAKLFAADLRGAHLEEADLRGADLTSTNLEGTFLARARLEDSVLRTDVSIIADLPQINLYGTSQLSKSNYRKYLRRLRSSVQFATDPFGKEYEQ